MILCTSVSSYGLLEDDKSINQVRFAAHSAHEKQRKTGLCHRVSQANQRAEMFTFNHTFKADTFWILILNALLIYFVQSLKIIIFTPDSPNAGREALNKLAQELAFRNHDVFTFRTLLLPEQPYLVVQRPHKVTEFKLQIDLPTEWILHLRAFGNASIWTTEYGDQKYLHLLWKAQVEACSTTLNSDFLDRLRQITPDVCIIPSDDPCALGIVHALKLPFIYYDSDGLQDETILSVRPQLFLQGLPPSSQFAKLWSMKQIRAEALAVFVNTDWLLEDAHGLYPPKIIPIGGFHMDLPRPLFRPYNESIDKASDGVIVVSFGNRVNSSAVPLSVARIFLQTFQKLPGCRIFWRIDSSTIDGISPEQVPSNVNLTQYLPQVDLLGARKTRMLISHGGAQSIMEAVHAGVPVLGIPLISPTYQTLRKLEARGMALILDKSNLTAQNLLTAILAVLRNKKYTLAAKQISKMFKDRPISPIDNTIHWIEFVGRYKRGSFFIYEKDILFSITSLTHAMFFSVVIAAFSLAYYYWMFGRKQCTIDTEDSNSKATSTDSEIDSSERTEDISDETIPARRETRSTSKKVNSLSSVAK
ncbi:UDP-glucoronosyl and UDP-glucosyl transferase [Trichinella nativa]|uniref:glucuronosyltransferase n=1 Tax=Trichinella nativa TaxID=6335 RepID=A0A1Y3EA37_9BILA|nr:UDP-glucoronosyl and UDP-glucosyl transferase [Trichinella nativa]